MDECVQSCRDGREVHIVPHIDVAGARRVAERRARVGRGQAVADHGRVLGEDGEDGAQRRRVGPEIAAREEPGRVDGALVVVGEDAQGGAVSVPARRIARAELDAERVSDMT
ncbi:hypothetical protein GQX73_g9611 [Xylaria multiplex]|uniref:Uncharacterized protein n=1 Tax=Xylaria multiplex TaxID=323545 RepID=A0A7C8IHP5_9PEZI|nr:hypothetical protein GQX73_g9611 [Xylaria multiplex]